MSQTIKELWTGNIDPCACCGAHDPAVKELVGLIERNRENSSRGLTAAQMEEFQKYIDCWELYLLHMLELAFRDGFSLGSKLAMEAMMT